MKSKVKLSHSTLHSQTVTTRKVVVSDQSHKKVFCQPVIGFMWRYQSICSKCHPAATTRLFSYFGSRSLNTLEKSHLTDGLRLVKVIWAEQWSSLSSLMQIWAPENKGFYESVIWETYRPGGISSLTPITPILHNFTYSWFVGALKVNGGLFSIMWGCIHFAWPARY